jgi:hypothetical protein
VSRVSFKGIDKKGHTVVVRAGWDHPVREFYMQIMDADGDCTWSTMASGGTLSSTASLKAKLVKLGVQAPEGFWPLVERREGNTWHTYENGAWQQAF